HLGNHRGLGGAIRTPLLDGSVRDLLLVVVADVNCLDGVSASGRYPRIAHQHRTDEAAHPVVDPPRAPLVALLEPRQQDAGALAVGAVAAGAAALTLV